MPTFDQKRDEAKRLGLKLEPPLFLNYQQPHGFLPPDRRAHGLWYYYLIARKKWEQEPDHGGIEYEGEVYYYKYDQLIESVAVLYDTDPSELTKFWDYVDKQCVAEEMPLAPQEIRFHSGRNVSAIIMPGDPRFH